MTGRIPICTKRTMNKAASIVTMTDPRTHNHRESVDATEALLSGLRTKTSCTKKMTTTTALNKSAAEIAKVALYPKCAAVKPPIDGPKAAPAKTAVWTMPRL